MKVKRGNVLAIDPGVRGGLAVLSAIGDVERLTPMPTLPYLVGKRERRRVDARKVTEFITKSIYRFSTVFIENVHAIRGDGGVQAFAFGGAVFTVRTVVELLGYEPEWIEARSWQRAFWQPGKRRSSDTKTLALQAVQKLYPELSLPKSGKTDRSRPHDGCVDAILIGRYGLMRRNVTG